MRLLFDENLAASLPRDVSDLYPGSNHVLALGLAGAINAPSRSSAATSRTAPWQCSDRNFARKATP